MPAPNAAALLRRNATDVSIRDRPAVKFGDRVWTHAEYVDEAQLDEVCAETVPLGLSTILKRIELDPWRESCGGQ